jgi:hypothetical protein
MEDLMEEMAESQLSSSPPIPLTPFLFALHQSDTSSIFSQLASQSTRQLLQGPVTELQELLPVTCLMALLSISTRPAPPHHLSKSVVCGQTLNAELGSDFDLTILFTVSHMPLSLSLPILVSCLSLLTVCLLQSLVQGRRLERERSLLCQQRGRGTRSKMSPASTMQGEMSCLLLPKDLNDEEDQKE